MTRWAFYTLGCRANQYQTELLKCRMTNAECRIVDFRETADIYLINTCAVTGDAERRSRQMVRRALKQNPAARIIVAGCAARLNRTELKKISTNIEIYDIDPLAPLPLGPLTPRVRADLMIQDGCDDRCAYCVVPLARGPVRSKPPEQVLNEAKALVAAGARELVLTGINLGAYGANVGTGLVPVREARTTIKVVPTLSNVITELSKIKNLLRIRLSSIEPQYLTGELIETVAREPKACHYFHLPLQTGSDRLLKAMGRKYTAAGYAELAGKVRRQIPDCGLSTDLIVGLPGETEEDFQQTVARVEQLRFSRLHVFPYSRRKGTRAAELPDQVTGKVKKERVKLLRQLGDRLEADFARQFIGQEVAVLIESPGQGLTSNYIRCRFSG